MYYDQKADLEAGITCQLPFFEADPGLVNPRWVLNRSGRPAEESCVLSRMVCVTRPVPVVEFEGRKRLFSRIDGVIDEQAICDSFDASKAMKSHRETGASLRARLRDLVTLALEHKKDGVKNYEPGVRIWHSYDHNDGTPKTYEFIFLGEDGYHYRFDVRELPNWVSPDRPSRPPYRTKEEWKASGSSLTFKDWLDQHPSPEWREYHLFEPVTLPKYIKTKIAEAIDLGYIEAIHGIKPVPG